MNINDLTVTPINPSMCVDFDNQNHDTNSSNPKKKKNDNLIFQRILDEVTKKQSD